jgi:hypothetical protein
MIQCSNIRKDVCIGGLMCMLGELCTGIGTNEQRLIPFNQVSGPQLDTSSGMMNPNELDRFILGAHPP